MNRLQLLPQDKSVLDAETSRYAFALANSPLASLSDRNKLRHPKSSPIIHLVLIQSSRLITNEACDI